jgi:hypothetical protein
VDSSDERGILLFEKHPMCHALTGWGSFTMRENALPDIALTSMSDWQQAQTLMVNQYRKYFVNQPNVPFKGNVYPADLVTKTALLEKEVARQKQILEEKERLIKELSEENARYLNPSDDEEEEDAEQTQETLADSERTMAELADKQARIEELEAALDENRKMLSDRTKAQSSRQAAAEDEARLRIDVLQQELHAANAEKDQLIAENRRVRVTWSGARTSADHPVVPPVMAPEITALFAQQTLAMQQQAQAQAQAMQQQDILRVTMWEFPFASDRKSQ